MRSPDNYRGCLVGGAAGDALGYAVEFMGEREIFRRYGDRGITEYALTNGKALISDDTQMTLFTAAGLLSALAHGKAPGDVRGYAEIVDLSYRDWLRTQERDSVPPDMARVSWLVNVPELFSPRAPGGTCLNALRTGGGGTCAKPINGSKGCGGVMRAAPVGLLPPGQWDEKDICRLGAETAAVTHGHPLGWLPGAALALTVYHVIDPAVDVPGAVRRALGTVNGVYGGYAECGAFTRLMEKALALAAGSGDDLSSIHQLGEGWVGDEALAIAVFCAARYGDDVDRALTAAVNHRGDSDSTGAIAGNIVGARVGLSGIPEKYKKDLELLDVTLQVADDMRAFGGADDPAWVQKYLDGTYRPAGA